MLLGLNYYSNENSLELKVLDIRYTFGLHDEKRSSALSSPATAARASPLMSWPLSGYETFLQILIIYNVCLKKGSDQLIVKRVIDS